MKNLTQAMSLFLVATLLSCAPVVLRPDPKPSNARVADARLAADVAAAFEEADLAEYHRIRIEAEAGEVTLRGRLRSESSALRAPLLTAEVDGVRSVVSRLSVSP